MNATLVARREKSHHHLDIVSVSTIPIPAWLPDPLSSPRPCSRPRFCAHHVSVFHASPDPSPISLSLLLLPAPRRSFKPHQTPVQICSSSSHWNLFPHGYSPCTANSEAWGIKHGQERLDSWGNIASTVQVISNRHVQTAGFGRQIWGGFTKRQGVYSQLRVYPSTQFQVLFPQHAGYRALNEKGHFYFLTRTKAYICLASFLKLATLFWMKQSQI